MQSLRKSDRHYITPQGIGKRIQELMLKEGLNESQFCKRIGMARPSIISMWIWGQREPRVSTVLIICKEFNVSSDWLIGLKEEDEVV